MATWTNLPDSVISHEKPITLQQGRALRDNPLAMAEGAAGAPYLRHWRPYDSIAVGDGHTGLIYDAAVHGVVASVTSPDFESGWDYRFQFDGVACDDSFEAGLVIELYGASAAAWSPKRAIGAASSVAPPMWGTVDLFDPAAIRQLVRIEAAITFNFSNNSWGDWPVAASNHRYSTGQARSKARFSFQLTSSGADNIGAGKIYMLRRPIYV